MSLRVNLPSILALIVVLFGCATPRPFELTIDGAPVDDGDVSAHASLSTTLDQTTIELRVNDPGPPGVVDAGVVFVFRLELAPSVAAGDVIDGEGHATMTMEAGGTSVPTDRAFTDEAGSDERFRGLFAWAECFCGSPGTFDEAVVAHVEIVDVTETTVTFSIDADITGRIPGRGFDAEHQVLRGTFTAERPAR